MLTLAGLFSHLAAAIGFGALALWLLIRHGDSASGLWLSAAAFATALWAAIVTLAAFYGGGAADSMAPFETLRNISWTGFLLSVLEIGRALVRTPGTNAPP